VPPEACGPQATPLLVLCLKNCLQFLPYTTRAISIVSISVGRIFPGATKANFSRGCQKYFIPGGLTVGKFQFTNSKLTKTFSTKFSRRIYRNLKSNGFKTPRPFPKPMIIGKPTFIRKKDLSVYDRKKLINFSKWLLHLHAFRMSEPHGSRMAGVFWTRLVKLFKTSNGNFGVFTEANFYWI